MDNFLNFRIEPQPDDTTCGPTCLQAIYAYYKDTFDIGRAVEEVPSFKDGGTLAVHLACHALKRGYKATIYTYNLQVFDPTWFHKKSKAFLKERLRRQMEAKKDAKLLEASAAYQEFLKLGGNVRFKNLTPSLIRGYLKRNVPILTGLSATYLYDEMRECADSGKSDDISGVPAGHFVVLCGYDRASKEVLVADPLESNPLSESQHYTVRMVRLLGAIFLGILTYDANFLVIEQKSSRKGSRRVGVHHR